MLLLCFSFTFNFCKFHDFPLLMLPLEIIFSFLEQPSRRKRKKERSWKCGDQSNSYNRVLRQVYTKWNGKLEAYFVPLRKEMNETILMCNIIHNFILKFNDTHKCEGKKPMWKSFSFWWRWQIQREKDKRNKYCKYFLVVLRKFYNTIEGNNNSGAQ